MQNCANILLAVIYLVIAAQRVLLSPMTNFFEHWPSRYATVCVNTVMVECGEACIMLVSLNITDFRHNAKDVRNVSSKQGLVVSSRI